MSEKVDWRDKLKRMMEQSAEGNYDESDQEVIVIPKGDEEALFKFLSELGIEIPELGFDIEIEKLIDAGKHVAFEDEERIH